jgi:hypothetical protein
MNLKEGCPKILAGFVRNFQKAAQSKQSRK